MVPRRHAGLPRARHGAPAVGRRLGRRHPPADRRGVARAAGDDAALPADCVRHGTSLQLDAPGGRRRRRAAAAQAALSEHAVLSDPCRGLFPGLERPVLFPQHLVARAGPHGRSAPRAQDADAQRRRPRRIWHHDHVRVVRLADVDRPALVLDHLRRADHRRAGPLGPGLPDRRRRLAEPPPAARSHRGLVALSRSRQPDARLRDAVGVLLVLAVPDHLVRQPAARDRLVPAPGADELAFRGARAGRVSLRRPVRAPALPSR